jgi:hypothetical protein
MREEIDLLLKKYPTTSYWKCGEKGTGKEYIMLFQNNEAESEAFEKQFSFSREEINLVLSLTENQRKIILLQSQKEKIEKELDKLLINNN